MKIIVREGNYGKLGVQQQKDRVIFTFCGEKEDSCAVVLVHREDKSRTVIEVPEQYCIGSLRSIAVLHLNAADYVYYFEVNGERRMDPYARAVMGREVWNDSARKENGYEVFGAFAREDFDWKDDVPPEIPMGRMFLYKLHVRGFTMDAGSRYAGTFRGLMNRIGYLKRLGATTLELMPVYEFEEMPLPPKAPLPEDVVTQVNWQEQENDLIRPTEPKEEAAGQLNYWGYGDGNYFAVKAAYASDPVHAAREFKTLIRRLHENQMECVMEMHFPADANHNMILDVLRYWVMSFHVDGFHLLGESIPVTAIAQDLLLSRTKIFCGGYDRAVLAAGRGYRNLYVYRDEYMYPARRLLNHLDGNMRDFIDQQRKQGCFEGYVNYVAGNNGFTLADLFMYNDRHNEANNEGNRDGNPWNYSNNYGVEGPTRKRHINQIRRLKWRNSVMMLMLAQGVPLLMAGDEIGNTQEGNNNAYCQDNPTGWVNWKNEKTRQRELAFLRQLVQFRMEHPIIGNEKPFQFSDYRGLGAPDVSFHGESAWVLEPAAGKLCVGMMYSGAYAPGEERAEDVYVAYNFFSAVSGLALPLPGKGKGWYLVMDSGNEKEPYLKEPLLQDESRITLSPQSICVLVTKRKVKKGSKKEK